MTLRKIHLVIVLQLALFAAKGQQGSEDNISDLLKTVEVIPPSPNAASLGQYGGLSPGLSTGMMSTSIPVYNYASKNIQVPISLSYSSNGFKVEDISSRTGVSWSLNAGGVITRTIYGAVDEDSQRKIPTSDAFTRSYIDDFLKPVSWSNTTAGYDAQPDMFAFNFNGYSGQFILDSNYHPVLLNYSNLKVEDNYASPNPQWDFKITTPEGVQYYFGGDSARDATDKNPQGDDCGHPLPEYFPVAYYLAKIVHPNNDSVVFKYAYVGYNYKTAISQNIFYQLSSAFNCFDPSYETCPTLNNYVSSCVTWLRTSGFVLKEINSSSGGKLLFSYKARKDVPLDSLLTKIELYQPITNALLRVFEFKYDDIYSTGFSNSYNNSDSTFGFRHFLKSITERSPDSALLKQYQFSYNNLSELPRRLAFAQDHYGIFNGQNNSNLLPRPATLTEQSYFPPATADRESYEVYSKKGLLSKITYPTGGSDTIFYEANTTWKTVAVLPPPQSFYGTADTEGSTVVYSDTATISFQQETYVYGSCEFYGTPQEDDPVHNKATITLYDQLNNAIFQQTIFPGDSITNNNIVNLLASKSYHLQINAYGTKVRGSASFDARIGNITNVDSNVAVGGIRVAKIVTRNTVSGDDMTRKFYYGFPDSLSHSSGIVINTPVYNKTHTVLTQCDPGDPGASPPQLPDCGLNVCTYLALFSSSQTNLFSFGSQPVYYRYVTEGVGENFENGGIQHEYTVVPDMSGNPLHGDNIIGAPLSNQSIKNGREIYNCVFRQSGAQTIPVKKTFTHFKDDIRYDSVFSAYVINRKVSPYCEDSVPNQWEEMAWDVLKYEIYTNWSYPDTLRTWTYDSKGQTYSEQLALTEYGNPSHALPTKITTYGSDGKSDVVNSFYPDDITLTGTQETARQSLLSKHMVSPVLRVQIQKDTAQSYLANTYYKVFPSNLVLPESNYVQVEYHAPEKRVEFFRYTQNGKILEQAKANDARISYIWDYQGMYPVAQISNADSAAVAQTSFEADGKGGWTYSGSVTTDSTSPTGVKCYNTSGGNITRSGLPSATYVISYWGKNGSVIVNGDGPSLSGRTYGSWTYYQHEVTATSITISGTKYIDELRLFPKGALMTSYTYRPLIGVATECDANNRITYYEYDGLGRLLMVRDQDNNIIKRICYNYAGQPENCIKFGNVVKSEVFTRNNCSCGYTGGQVTYTVPADTYFSSVSQADADQQAQNDVNANGQTYANTNGSCTAITFYARIELANIYNDIDYSSADVYIRFYSNSACTIPASACGLNVNYKKVRTLCSGGSPITYNYTQTNCTGTQVLLGNFIISQDDGIHCYNYTFSTTSGTGYTPK